MSNMKQIAINQCEREVDDGTVLYSYLTPVAIKLKDGGGAFRCMTKHSRTTSKHITQWLDGQVATEIEDEYFERYAL